MQFGSVMNDLMDRGTINQPKPTVNDGATVLLWSDRHAATIISVEDRPHGGWRIVVQEDTATVVKGSTFDGSAEYEYSANPDGVKRTYEFFPKEGRWRQLRTGDNGRFYKIPRGDGDGLTIGQRREYRDPTF